jgi:hypothetical protein
MPRYTFVFWQVFGKKSVEIFEDAENEIAGTPRNDHGFPRHTRMGFKVFRRDFKQEGAFALVR